MGGKGSGGYHGGGRKKKVLTPEEIEQHRINKLERTSDIDAVDWLKIHPEDIPMAKENLLARDRGYDNDGVRRLFAAVSLVACIDYRKALAGKRVGTKYPDKVIYECEKFFKGDIFRYFINRISNKEVKKTIRALPVDVLEYLWKKNELGESSKQTEPDVAKNTMPIIEE